MKIQKLLGQVVPLDEGTSLIGMHYLEQKCSVDGCESHIVRALDVTPSDIGIKSDSNIYLDRCLNCNIYASVVSHQYDQKGNITWSSNVDDAECNDVIDDYGMEGSFAAVKWSPFDESIKRDCGPIFAGGEIEWAQGAYDMKCPKCSKEMIFILQIPSSALDNNRDENGFPIGPYQQKRWGGTKIESFSMSFDGTYATCYLFKCFDCNVCTNFTQTS